MPNLSQSVPAVFAYSGLDGINWYNNTGSVVGPGQVIALESVQRMAYGITRQPIPVAAWGNLAIVGIFDLELDGASTFVVGDSVYWNANTNRATSSGSYSSDLIGCCVAPTASRADVSVRTRLSSLYGSVLGPATTARLSGPTTASVGVPVTYTVSLDGLAPSGGVSCPVACTNGWTVTTSPVVIAENRTYGTFTVTPTTENTSAVSLSATTPVLTRAGSPISLVATALPATEIMWGWSTNTTLNSAQIVGLDNNNPTGSSPVGTYNYTIPSGSNFYYYLCYPDSFGDFTSAMIGAFNWSVAGSGDTGGSTYTHTFTGAGVPYTYALVSVSNPPASTVNYRVFRSQFYVTTATSLSIVVS